MGEMRKLEFDFALGTDAFHMSADVPIAPVRPRRMLPLFQEMANKIVDSAVKRVEAKGEAISCKAGCGACCRQVVPISGAEARHVRALVSAMPASKRAEVRARFEAAVARLKEAGLYTTARNANALPDEEDAAFVRRYMALRIACPFLEDESCSIHPQRPTICREYLVTSPADRCVDPTADGVRTVPMPARLSRGVVQLEVQRQQPVLIPLVLSLEWAEAHDSKEPSARPPKEWLDVVMRAMA